MTSGNKTQKILQSIEGGQALLDWLSGFYHRDDDFPNFGDAEVVSFHMRRKAPSELSLLMKRHTNSALVTFHLSDWVDARLTGFSHQNVLGNLTIREAGQRDIAVWEQGVGCIPGVHEIELHPCFGAYGTIRATLQKVRLELL